MKWMGWSGPILTKYDLVFSIFSCNLYVREWNFKKKIEAVQKKWRYVWSQTKKNRSLKKYQSIKSDS